MADQLYEPNRRVSLNARYLRITDGLTQEELGAELAGQLGGDPWTRQSVSAMEAGKRQMTADLIAALAQIFAVRPEHFFVEPECPTCGHNPS